MNLKPYSLCRGGATYDYASGGDLQRTLWRGRWSAPATGRIYIQEGAAMLAQMRLNPEGKQRLETTTAALKQWVVVQGGVVERHNVPIAADAR